MAKTVKFDTAAGNITVFLETSPIINDFYSLICNYGYTDPDIIK
jgi:hypothetical protein